MTEPANSQALTEPPGGARAAADILIAEDSPTQAQVLRRLLEMRGHRVTAAEDGAGALAAAREKKPTLIISDVEMPVMGGYDLCRAIKRDRSLSDIPVILLTSLSEASDVLRGLEAGADYYLTKPYDAEYLLAQVELVLANPPPAPAGDQDPLGILFAGQRHVVTANRQQILNLLLSTYSSAVQRNAELIRVQRELTRLNRELTAQTAQLRQSEERYRSVVEQTAEGIYLVDALTRRVVESNMAFQSMLGYTAAELQELSVYDVVAHDRASIDSRFEQVLATASHATAERSYRRKDQSLLDVEASAGVISYGGRKVLCTVVRDITERKRAQARLEEQNELLQQAVKSECAAHDALKQAQIQMVQTEKLAGLGQMVAGIAHEINNPLSFISNNIAILQRYMTGIRGVMDLYKAAEVALNGRPELLQEIHERCEQIDIKYALENTEEVLLRSRDGLQRIHHIVKDLRDFARLDESDLSDVDINLGVESTVRIISNRANDRKVTLALDLGKLPLLACYPAKINQVVMNLLSNAIDASPPGAVVTVRTRADQEGLEIRVIDAGAGVDPAVRDKIFDPFFTTKPLGQGTGLGLSISYGIVRDHGGSITVESTPSAGSTFIVRLPHKQQTT